SLGVLAYECLTGHCPFVAEKIGEIARKHLSEPVPELGPPLPEALNPVLRQALAKNLKERFQTAIEFADAIRDAAGLEAEAESLPQIEQSLRETIVTHAPQPLAEAIGALEATRTVKDALHAIVQLYQITSRYLGILALAARARVGWGGPGDSPRLTEL